MDGDLVNLFRCFQDPSAFGELRHRLSHTLYSRAEFCRALNILSGKEPADSILRAWALFVRQNMAFGAIPSKGPGSWGRSFISVRGSAATTSAWIGRMAMFETWHQRLARVQIERRDAIEVIRHMDNRDAVFYVDPPYHLETRVGGAIYKHEAGHDHHVALVDILLRCDGAVVLSGYDHPVYSPLVAAGWNVTRYAVSCSAAVRTRNSGLRGLGAAKAKVPRTEMVWANPRATEMMRAGQAIIGLV
jgi:DNA adenine methylase